MSHPDIMIGYIVEPQVLPNPCEYIAEWNDRVLGALPRTDDTQPPLCRSMFSVPPLADAKLNFRGSRVITFGIHRNYFHADVGLWLPKFESLLKQLLWREAQIYVDSDYSGDFDLSFQPTDAALGRLSKEQPPAPPDTWEFRCTFRATDTPANHIEGITARPGYTDVPRHVSVPDKERVTRMLADARDVAAFIHGKRPEDLAADKMLLRALTHAILSFGREAAQVTTPTRKQFPSVRWNQLPHGTSFAAGGFDDNQRKGVWEIAAYAPDAIAVLEQVLAQWPPDKR